MTQTRWNLPLFLLATLAACEEDRPPVEVPQNAFGNGSFEQGRDPWFSLKPPDFIVSDQVANSGLHSAHLPLHVGTDADGYAICYLVQEITPAELPEVIWGYYRVDNWKKGTQKQYLQFAVIVFSADNMPGPFPNHQLRYVLAGIDSPPFSLSNARFVFLGKDEPVPGRWVRFECNVRDDFEKLWKTVPQGFDKIRVMFEVRCDNKRAGEGPVHADVYYDDLYWGPAPAP